ncbi:MAG: c-type cytochrome [Leptospirillia bacterium]
MHSDHFRATALRLSRGLQILTVGLLTAGLFAFGCSKSDTPPTGGGMTKAAVAPTDGAGLFTNHCAGCHGEGARGSDQGPPLVHKIYEPSHHPDMAFYRAASAGVRAHHWGFGNMPPIDGVKTGEMTAIISYVRALQRDAGIY